MKIEAKNFTVNFSDDPDLKDKVFEAVLLFYLKQEAFNGESIEQNDGPYMAAPDLLSKMADELFQFDVERKEE